MKATTRNLLDPETRHVNTEEINKLSFLMHGNPNAFFSVIFEVLQVPSQKRSLPLHPLSKFFFDPVFRPSAIISISNRYRQLETRIIHFYKVREGCEKGARRVQERCKKGARRVCERCKSK